MKDMFGKTALLYCEEGISLEHKACQHLLKKHLEQVNIVN